ncbi:MAG: M13 family metallopeptidase, partial [Myxococcota bacterium]
PPPPPAFTLEVPAPGTFGATVYDALDPSADPCNDFYQFACGGWVAKNPLPADRPISVRGFTEIEDRNEAALRQVLDAAAASSDPSKQKLGAFWKSCNDEAAVEAKGAAPMAPYFDAIEKVLKKDKKKNRAQLMALVGQLQADGFGPFLSTFVDGDAKNPSTVILQLYQGGTGLPERDYYTEAQFKDIRDQYQKHVQKMFELSGWSVVEATEAADLVVAFETELARVQWTPEQLRDSTLTYNKLDRAGLEKITPGLDWSLFFTAVGTPALTQINVATPSFFEGLGKLVAATPAPVLRRYLEWQVISGSAPHLSKAFVDESFGFYGKTLAGMQEQRPRWKRCVEAADGALGDLLAADYVAAAFPGDSKPVSVDMIQRIEGAFEAGLPNLGWMDDATRARAIEKARAVTNKIGYPNQWRTYGFEVRGDDLYGNVRRASRATNDYWLAKVEKPVDPDTWLMTAPTVNAYYNPSANEIVFPAGILQPPFFSVEYPKAYNFGAIGMVMGHELTHGFDDEGRKYDGKGMLTEWWAPEVVQKFEVAAKCVQDKYETFPILPAEGDKPAVHVKGELTMGENIADIGGLRLAHRAYQKWVADNGPEAPVAGLNGEQMLFVAMAQGWCSNAAPEFQRMLAETDPHSPPKWRVNGPMSMLPEFHAAFACEPGEPMRPDATCEVW